MAQTTSSATPTTLTTQNHPFPVSTPTPSTLITSGSLASTPASITSYSSLSSIASANGTFNSTATTSSTLYGWDCSSGSPSRASLFENFSGCTYAQSTTPTPRPSNGTTNGTVSGSTPLPTTNAGLRVAAGVEFGSIGALGLVLVAMMGWL